MKNRRISKKTILHISVVVVTAIVILIFLSTVVLPPIMAYKDFAKILGFELLGEELEFQVLDRYYHDGKSKYPDYAAKYVIYTEQLLEIEDLIENASILDNDGIELKLYEGGTQWYGTEIENLNFTHRNPNNPMSPRFYADPHPSPWWDFSNDDIVRFYFGSYGGSPYIDIFLVSEDEYIFIYIYVRIFNS